MGRDVDEINEQKQKEVYEMIDNDTSHQVTITRR